jgi:chromosome segregation ATPase
MPEFQALIYEYQCSKPQQLPDVPHPRPFSRYGRTLDWEVWRRLVDYGINRPDFITDYILDRQAELQAQGDDVDGNIAHARQKSTEINQERAFYQRQAARGKMTEAEFDARMEETKETLNYWESEIIRLHDLRDNVAKVQAGIEYVNQLLASIQTVLPEVDIPPNELKAMSMEKREEVMKVRQEIVRSLVEKVTVWASGQVKIEGALDGSEATQFELGSS